MLRKEGGKRNELTQYRYRAILGLSSEPRATENVRSMDWQEEGLTLEMLDEVLREEKPEIIRITNIPNARVEREAEALRLIHRPDAPRTVEELRERLSAKRSSKGMSPET